MNPQTLYDVTIYKQEQPIDEAARLTKITHVSNKTRDEAWELALKLVRHPVLHFREVTA